MRVRFLIVMVCSMVIPVVCAPSALAGGPGGVVASGPAPAAGAPKPHLHLAPVTSRNQSLAYKGPVYERTATGQIVPYVPAPTPAPAARPGIGTAASTMTGGSSASSPASTPATPPAPAGPTPRPELLVPGATARYVAGLAAAPMAAPLAIQEMIWAGNQLIGLPYIYGGGHASFVADGYDCSGTVSFALHGASLLSSPEDSSEFMGWGSHGVGRWVAVFATPEHAYMTVAGLRLDTSSADDPSNQQGPRWRPLRRANSGYTVTHPLGL